MPARARHGSFALVAIVGLLAACEPATGSSPTPNSGQSGATANPSASAPSAALTLVYQAINSSDHSIHEAVVRDSLVADHIVVNDTTISFLLGFTGRTTIAVRKDAPGTTEIGTIDINTGAYHQAYSMVHSSLEEMLGPALSPDGTYAAFVDQNGTSTDWLVLDMTTGQTRSLNLTNGGAVVAWTSSYILFNTGFGLIEVDPQTGARSSAANTSDYTIASPDGSHLAGAIYRNLGDPQWCLNTVVTGSPVGPEGAVAAGENTIYQVLGVANTGDMLFAQSACGSSPQQALSAGNASVEFWHSGRVIQQFPQSATDRWASAKFVAESSALMQRDALTQENTSEGPARVTTASELDLVDLCAVSGCQPSTVRISQAQGLAAGYEYFAKTE